MPRRDKSSRNVRPLKSKGMATRSAILDAAHEVFKDTGYYGSSISEISRRCGISMGTFYHYFKNKEQVFLELNDKVIARFKKRAEVSPPSDLRFRDRLRSVIGLLLDHTRDNFAFHRILGESELIDRVTIAFYDSITQYYRDFFHREIQGGNIRPLDADVVAYSLIGICYFNTLDWGSPHKNPARNQILDLITDLALAGISGPVPWKKPPEWDLFLLPDPSPLHSENRDPLTRGEKTRQAILQAAGKVIGRYGINRASISEITRYAGVAQGTFYVHFKSKGDLVIGFVRYINRELRKEIQRFVSVTQDRRDAERVGMLAFFQFLRQHREIYRVVPECEMISREVALWYYRKLAEGYIKGLKRGMERGEIRDLPVAFVARSLMGLVHFIGLKQIVWNPDPAAESNDLFFTDMVEFALFGLEPS